MGRGISLRTRIRKEILASEPAAIAVEQARQKLEDKRSFLDRLEEHLWLLFDRIDPLQAVAVVGIAVKIHDLYYTNTEVINRMEELRAKHLISKYERVPVAAFSQYYKSIGFGEEVPKDIEEQTVEWLFAFAIAYYVVTKGVDIGIGLIPIILKFLIA